MRYIKTNSKIPYTRLYNYKNVGQDIEQSIRYTVTGKICKADNIPCTQSGDLRDCQIKSSGGRVCKGTNIQQHIQQDKAKRYIYGALNDFAYVLTKEQYYQFVQLFSRITTDSTKEKNVITRLKDENKSMIEWLEKTIQH